RAVVAVVAVVSRKRRIRANARRGVAGPRPLTLSRRRADDCRATHADAVLAHVRRLRAVIAVIAGRVVHLGRERAEAGRGIADPKVTLIGWEADHRRTRAAAHSLTEIAHRAEVAVVALRAVVGTVRAHVADAEVVGADVSIVAFAGEGAELCAAEAT